MSQVWSRENEKKLLLCPSSLPGSHTVLADRLPFTFPSDTEKVPLLHVNLQVAWLWSIFFAFAAPEVFTFLHSAWVCLMKVSLPPLPPGLQTYETPSVLEFGLVLLFEGLHTLGTGILFFLAFPGMDSIRALMATNAVCLFPGMLKLFMKQSDNR